MTNGDRRPPGSTDKHLGDILGEISSNAALLVRAEIELAKVELKEKGERLVRGAVVGVVAGLFAVLGLLYLLHGIAWAITAIFGLDNPWVGYLIVTAILFALGAVAGVVARRFVLRGIPPTPELAIEEAKRTREAIDRARP